MNLYILYVLQCRESTGCKCEIAFNVKFFKSAEELKRSTKVTDNLATVLSTQHLTLSSVLLRHALCILLS